MTPYNFCVSVETDNATGEVLTAYFQIRKGKVHSTHEFADGAAYADYNRKGELLGVEVLSTCKISVVDQLAANESADVRARTKRFIRQNGPRHLIAI